MSEVNYSEVQRVANIIPNMFTDFKNLLSMIFVGVLGIGLVYVLACVIRCPKYCVKENPRVEEHEMTRQPRRS